MTRFALVTGEEKISPPNARYSVCTVEAMPRETRAPPFVAIDEVQLHRRRSGARPYLSPTVFCICAGATRRCCLGAGTMRPILEQLLPGITVVERPRLSHLSSMRDRRR